MSAPANQTLDLANVITVSILAAPVGLSLPNVNTCALMSNEAKPAGWAGDQTYAVYTNPGDVATDWGLSSNAYAIALQFFAQNPNPLGTNGYLVIIPRQSASVLAAITANINKVFFFGVLVDSEYNADQATFLALATYVQSVNKMLFYCSSHTADFQPGGLLDLVRQASEQNVRCFYYGNAILNGAAAQQTQIFAGAYAGRALSTNFSGSLTAQTMHLKQLTGITPDQTITQTLLTAAGVAGVDLYVSISGYSCLFTSGANEYFDQAYSRMWLKFALETAGFNYLAGTNTKVPQTESGMTGLKDAYAKVLAQAVANGYLAPGAWYSATTFGNPQDLARNVSDVGYYIYSTPVAQQSPADRLLRKAPVVQIAAQEAGAIHSSAVIVNVEA